MSRSITYGRNSVKKVIHGCDADLTYAFEELANFLIVRGQRKEEPSRKKLNHNRNHKLSCEGNFVCSRPSTASYA